MWGTAERVVVDGLPLRVVRAGSGPPLLLINGIGAAAEMWAPLAERLTGHELVAFDLPGSGSSPPSPKLLRVRGLARLVVGLLDVLGYDQPDVLGYSFGGIVAQELAWRAPGRVGHLVLCASTPGVGSLPPRPLPALLMLAPTRYRSRAMAERIVPVIAGGRTRREPAALQANLMARLANPPSTRGYLGQVYAVAGWSSIPWLRRVRHPTLILHGEEDPLVPLANARTMAELMPAAQLEVIAGGGHLFLLDEPDSAIERLTAFLARTPPARG